MKPSFKEWLQVTGQSYRDFAEKAHMKAQWVERIANGKQNLKLDTALRVYKLTNCEVLFSSLFPLWDKVAPEIKQIIKEEGVVGHAHDERGKYL